MAEASRGLTSGVGHLDPKKDPARRCRKLADWPERDRTAWAAALTPATALLDEAGLAAHWRPATQKSVRDAYGRWLAFLDRQGGLVPGLAPGRAAHP